ncbi:MAG: ArsR/SmtB family transcription factor [Candidatus Izemoplasmataceae bacterium]|jgi:ArsR family transcriptional regulator, arsenate/arsenite/antimonite-responsive transcriptional repressor|uniref:ArsR/SmtB family transcription factor n=1 Tax=Liberiplasma polymorphum TaxID=3374570 RepID=UPI0037753F22
MENLSALFKLLSDETRLRILLALKAKSFCVCELVELLNESQPKISKHLSKLKDLGYVQSERKDQFIYYSHVLNDTTLHKIINLLEMDLLSYPVLNEDRKRIDLINQRPFSCTLKDEGSDN